MSLGWLGANLVSQFSFFREIYVRVASGLLTMKLCIYQEKTLPYSGIGRRM